MKLDGGGRFKKLSGSVAKSYEKKGISKAKAEKVGAAVAAKAGMKRYGKAKMASMATKGKK